MNVGAIAGQEVRDPRRAPKSRKPRTRNMIRNAYGHTLCVPYVVCHGVDIY